MADKERLSRRHRQDPQVEVVLIMEDTAELMHKVRVLALDHSQLLSALLNLRQEATDTRSEKVIEKVRVCFKKPPFVLILIYNDLISDENLFNRASN